MNESRTIRLSSGYSMPLCGLGTWNLRGKKCIDVTAAALSVGCRLVDTAHMYSNEKEVGKGIRESGVRRDEIFITSKICSPDTTKERCFNAIRQSLENMQLDYLDLMLIHEPYSSSMEMYEALEEGVSREMVRSIGVSNFVNDNFVRLYDDADLKPSLNQVEGHVYFIQEELKKEMDARGVVMQAWAPFSEGRKNIFREPLLNEIGSRYGRTAAQVALRYLIDRGIAVIAKSSNIERIKENIDIFSFSLSEEDISLIRRLDERHSLFGWYN